MITYSRPGYGGSTRAPGRSVVDCAADTAAILDHLGAGRALTLGWSGGGPHTLAVAGFFPERVSACATIAGAAPCGVPDLDFLAGMGKENIEEFGAAMEGAEALTDVLERDAKELADVGPDELADALGDLIPEVDRASLTGEFAAFLAEAVHEALRPGIGGWFDDDLAFVRPWGFDLSEIRVPVFVWQGAQDRMVPFSHGQWLADHVPGATPRLFDDEGHLSIAVGRFGEILDDLLESA
jgi:pimeloyl-ACP methyl ester carboxylesterase